MIKFGKKTLALILAVMMFTGVLVGCTTKKDPSPINENAVLMTIGDVEIKAGICNFYLRYQQSLMESLYASMGSDYNIWNQSTGSDQTYEDVMKKIMLEQFQDTLYAYIHAADYGVELTEEELANIDAQAEKFAQANSERAQKYASATKEYAVEYMKIHLVAKKVADKMKDDIDTTVSDEEANQKRMRYYLFAITSSMTADEKAAKKTEAETFLQGAKDKGSLSEYATEKSVESVKVTFDAKTTKPEATVITEADKLAEGAFTLVETEKGYYVMQLESLKDEEATNAKKESILAERGEKRYDEILEQWKKDEKVKVNQKVLDTIGFNDIKVNSVKPSKTEDDSKEEGGEESGEGSDEGGESGTGEGSQE